MPQAEEQPQFLTKIGVSCRWCAKKHEIIVKTKDFAAYQAGQLAQRAFPYLSADQREMLITRTCGECWHTMMVAAEELEEEVENGK
jgi:hypothetical protein